MMAFGLILIKTADGQNPPDTSNPIANKNEKAVHHKLQENYNTLLEHTPGNSPLANHERNPIIACW